MTTIRGIVGTVERIIREQFVSVTVESCWVDLYHSKDGKYGINITAFIKDIKYEHTEEDEYCNEYPTIRTLDGSYDMEYEDDLDPETELNETNLEDVVWWMCQNFKVDHIDD